MRRIARIQQRKRQTWLALSASGIEEVGLAAEQKERTAKLAEKRQERSIKNCGTGCHMLFGRCSLIALVFEL